MILNLLLRIIIIIENFVLIHLTICIISILERPKGKIIENNNNINT